MLDTGDTARSKLEFLYRDVLGEVARLVEKLEAVSSELREVAKARTSEGTVEALARASAVSAAKVRAELECSAETACRQLATGVQESARALRELQRARARDYLVWGIVYVGASMLGGAVAALLLRIP